MREFLGRFPADAEQWQGILQSVKATIGGKLSPSDLLGAIRNHYQL